MKKSNSIGRCFVATAAYGDPNHPMVQTFRMFRDTVLIDHSLGEKFIKWYYRNGPIFAEKISGHTLTCFLVRSFLTPVSLFIKLLFAITRRSND